MKTRQSLITGVILAVALTGCAISDPAKAPDPPPGGFVQLSGLEVKALHADHRAVGKNPQGRFFDIRFHGNGRLTALLGDGTTMRGAWRVNGRGQICRKWDAPDDVQEICYAIFRKNGLFQAISRSGDQNIIYSIEN